MFKISIRTALFAVLLTSTLVTNSLWAPRLFAEEGLSLAEAKALNLIQIPKHITWPNEKDIKEFRLGFYGRDNDVFKVLRSKQPLMLKGKPFTLYQIDLDNPQLDNYHIIFITDRQHSSHKTVFKNSQQALIINDGRVRREFEMLNLLTSSKEIKISLNQENLSKKGFKASINLLQFAGSKEDISLRLRETDNQLSDIYKQVNDKQLELDDLNDSLANKTQKLNAAYEKITDHEEQLVQLTENILSSKNELNENSTKIDEQQRNLEKKSNQLRENEQAEQDLRERIQENKSILENQLGTISDQNDAISDRDETITEQRSLLWVFSSIAVIFLVMSYFLWRANYYRRKTNQELNELNNRLYILATTDSMTKLYNRRHFMELAEKNFNTSKKTDTHCCVLMMDIDHFKRVNDSHGHAAGDTVITGVGNIFKDSLRTNDIVGRLGGEEYAMLLGNCSIDMAIQIAQRLVDTVAAHEIQCADCTLKVTVSIGASEILNDDYDVDQLLVRADKALYIAKEGGRNRVAVS